MYQEVKIANQNTKKTKQAEWIEKKFTLVAICIIKTNNKRQKKPHTQKYKRQTKEHEK